MCELGCSLVVDPESILPALHNPFIYARALAPDEAMARPESAELLVFCVISSLTCWWVCGRLRYARGLACPQ
jgi:hypothetical protein